MGGGAHIARRLHGGPGGRVVRAFVQAQALWGRPGRRGPLHDDGPKRCPQQALLDAGLCAVGQGRRTAPVPPSFDPALGGAARFAQAPVGGLPLPVHPPQVVALGQEGGPQDVEDGLLRPMHEGTVHVAAVAGLGGQVVPLAPTKASARPNPLEDAVEGQARVGAPTSFSAGESQTLGTSSSNSRRGSGTFHIVVVGGLFDGVMPLLSADCRLIFSPAF